MSQDTRKDKRAKVVNLNVRYKSATVDEFIENHSHDVSRGGVFVKTASPFAPGTLLKFEIRIAGNQSVIAGVGRVVWKRESNQAAADKPAGMGVKFIKVDDTSRALIDRLVAEKADAGQAFTSELAGTKLSSAPPPATKPANTVAAARPAGPAPGAGAKPEPPRTGLGPPPKRNATVIGVAPASGAPHATAAPQAAGAPGNRPHEAKPPEAKPAATKSVPPRPQGARKATMIGIGSSPPMFPNATPGEPAPEPTVMKQAAELLEEALKEAGGSLDEIGQNPLFSAPTTGAAASNTATLVGGVTKTADATPAPAAAALADTIATTVSATATPAPVATDPPTATPAPVTAVTTPASSTPPRATPEPTPTSESATVPLERVATSVLEESSDVLSQPTTPIRRLSDDLTPAKKKSRGGAVFAAIAAIVAAGGGAYAWSTGMFGAQGVEPEPAPSAEPPSSVAATEIDAGETAEGDADVEELDGAAAAIALGELADAAGSSAAANEDAGQGDEDASSDVASSKKSEPTPEPKIVKASSRRHTGSRKPAATATTEAASEEATAPPAETAEPTPSEPKPSSEPKPAADPEPAETKPATEAAPTTEAKPAEAKPATEATPTEAKPATEAKSTDTSGE